MSLHFPIADPPLTDALVAAVLAYLEASTRDEKGCLIWGGPTCGKDKRGCVIIYLGRERVDGKEHLRRRVYLASRLVRRMYAEDLTDMDLARHTCDEPQCADWMHIIPGTPSQNTRDCIERGRGNRRRKLSDEGLVDAMARRAKGETFPSIAADYGVHWTTIQAAIRRRSQMGLLAAQPAKGIKRLSRLAGHGMIGVLRSRGIRLCEPPTLFSSATSGLRDLSNYASHPRWFALPSNRVVS